MGIKQLTTYVRDHFNILYTDEFSLPGQKLVFDGGALYYGLVRNNSDKRFGGDYFDIYTEFKSYFSKLKEIGITPYIVLDGGSNIPIKNVTISERFLRDVKSLRNLCNMKMGQSNLPKPRHLKSVFIEVLIELQINFVLAKGEADMLVAALANRLSCPLVSGDSDFFVVNVVHGVIPMDPLLILRSNTTKCVRYRIGNMSRHLKINENLLPMIAVMMGNDYSDDAMLHPIQMQCGAKNNNGSLLNVNDRVRSICGYLNRFRSIEEVVSNLSKDNNEVKNHIRLVLREFDLKHYEDECNELFPILNKVFSVSEKTTPIVNPNVPTERFLHHLVYHGLANPCVLDIYLHKTHFIRPQCDDISRKSCSESAEKLRTYLYILLLYQKVINKELTVSEFKRIGDGFNEMSIQVSIPEWTRVFPVDVVNGHYKSTDKVVIFCDLTRFPIESLKSVKEEDRMFMISVRYWIQQSSDSGCTLKIEHVEALMLCYLHLKSGKALSRCSVLDLATAHHYCRWQSILFYLTLLNTIFRYPFVPPFVSKVYHGNHVHQLFHLLDEGADKYTILVSKADKDMFNDYMDVLTTSITSCLIYKHNNFRKRTRDDEQPPMQRPPMQRPPMQRPPMQRPPMQRPPIQTFRQQPSGNRFAPFFGK